ncbi:lysyl-tRNA synthetase [Catenulispora acidiphila DSM 44928]|uniref:Lysine--tRNA ligase n=1 Tax=Catenulispora acidiphila (strain DSM 44928 / JCM 14897 / NBRC 102108 / NRRL B-24433 / ID139908) TaxID=479433 RepID=C7PWU3_CATAD|nr:bifunctional lysylphosphatidylglycerol synthetase/lysine--tRNA ligase LysX [Catenulispora acidiphila]ACU77200.1 lysyl-tRNA synthetase [Catenulispora acidiphila DSM 44928]
MTETTPPPAQPESDLPEQIRIRREKLDKLRERGVDPYPVGYPRTATVAELRAEYSDLEADVATGQRAGITGRVVLSRTGGKLCFATLREGEFEIQAMFSLDRLGAESLENWKGDVDLGDLVGVTGEIITSRRGELSIMVESWAITAKCLRPLPDKHKGLNDPEARVRQRYVDLIVNPEARRMLFTRSDLVRSLRSSLGRRGYTEVETPMLQPIHGGANARPFETHINAYDMKLYLRIAPELYLKRLLVGGVEKVFEINRNFRNEGADSTHSPEFTMLEAYEVYGDYDVMQKLTQQTIQEGAEAIFGSQVARRLNAEGEVEEFDISGDWKSVTVNDAVSAALGEEISADTEIGALKKLCDSAGIPYAPGWTRGQVVLEMYEHLVEDKTVLPTFYRDFPKDVSPLTRAHRTDPRLAERWDLVGWGAEIGTGYSELIDPVDQRERFTEQSLLAAGGDPDAMQLDEDFLRALEYAMPPAGGIGVGIDRILMALTGRLIRETILFPFVKPA